MHVLPRRHLSVLLIVLELLLRLSQATVVPLTLVVVKIALHHVLTIHSGVLAHPLFFCLVFKIGWVGVREAQLGELVTERVHVSVKAHGLVGEVPSVMPASTPAAPKVGAPSPCQLRPSEMIPIKLLVFPLSFFIFFIELLSLAPSPAPAPAASSL